MKINSDKNTIKPVSAIKPVPRSSIKKILFIKPSSLGDIFHALPAFYFLKASLPHCQIDWLINKNFASVLEFMKKDINKIVYFDREVFKTKGALKGLLELVSSIRKDRYDLVVDLQGLLRSALMAYVARADKRAGFAETKEKISALLYNEKISVPKRYVHAIEKNVYLVSKILKTRFVIPDYDLNAIKRCRDRVNELLKKSSIKSSGYIAFAPGARWETKCWPPQFFAEVADTLNKNNPKLQIVLIGSGADKEIANDIMKKCKLSKPVSFVGKTNLCELVELLRSASALLTNDSGPMHIAAALRNPVFALFGPTDPQKTGPFWQWHKVYQNEKGCIKCLKRECNTETLECQKAIKPKDVANDIVGKLKLET